ncbi:MAG: hypothetical protein AB1673_13040 [Actinomycetota bacterium]
MLSVVGGVVLVSAATAGVARQHPLPAVVVTGLLGVGCLITSGRGMIKNADSILKLTNFGKKIYLFGLAVGLIAGGLYAMWAGFHTPIDPVPVLGGALMLFGGFTMFIVWVYAA